MQNLEAPNPIWLKICVQLFIPLKRPTTFTLRVLKDEKEGCEV